MVRIAYFTVVTAPNNCVVNCATCADYCVKDESSKKG